MHTCYPRIWLALTRTPLSLINENFDASRARELPCKWHPLCCVFHQAEEPLCSDDLCPPPWIIAAAYSTALYDRPTSRNFAKRKKKKKKKNSGKKLACTVTHRENDGVEITMVLRLLITIRRENETERKACCTKPWSVGHFPANWKYVKCSSHILGNFREVLFQTIFENLWYNFASIAIYAYGWK